jgi:isopentenyl diphosphate isomerase/L-lactate dehydrogenase-like FMN-dependent dehydrogenase
MKIQDAANLDDVVALARRRIPKFAFDYLDSGAGDDAGVRRNAEAFGRVQLTPRYLRGLNQRKVSITTELFGQTYALPFGMAPTGMNQVLWPGADLMIGQLAKQANFPVVNSTLATCSLEKLAAAAPGNTWFQLYPRSEDATHADLLARAWAAGIRVLVVTADLPSAPNRNRDARNKFGVGTFRFTPQVVLNTLRYPSWLLAWARHRDCSFENLIPYIGAGVSNEVMMRMGSQTKQDFGWDDLARLRSLWKGRLVVKGILHPDDARQCVEHGADGVWVSNHGGRQLESAPAALDCLSAIADAVGGKTKVLFDSGVRSGEDVVKAVTLGADFVFLGRALLYGAAAGGRAGAQRVLDLYTRDVARTLAQIGCPSVQALNRDWVHS